jgi:hypothetical protein
MKKILAPLLISLLLSIAAFPSKAQQSSPGWTFGYVPTPAEWNFWWGKKVDWAGAAYCPVTGCAFTGPITSVGTLNITPGNGVVSFNSTTSLNISSTTSLTPVIGIFQQTNDSGGSFLALEKFRGTGGGPSTAVLVNDSLGTIQWYGADSNGNSQLAAFINARVTSVGVGSIGSVLTTSIPATLTADTIVNAVTSTGPFRGINQFINSSAANNAAARVSVATGLANVYELMEVNNATGTPNAVLSVGLGVTGGLSINTGAGNIALNAAANVTVSGPLLATTSIASIGYGTGTGAGSTVTQLTSRTTGVTLNLPTGGITLFSAAGSTTATTFTVTNSTVAAVDVIKVVQKSGTNLYEIFVTAVAAGSFNITFLTTGGTATDAPVFEFVLIKGSQT